jgi:DNA end-binding protein Ku
MASRIVWRGAVSFGLVHVPVVLHAAARANDLDFDWLDRRDMANVGYSRINKRTGKPIDKEFIVKGYQYQKGEYVLFSDEDFRRANVSATQTVEILSFVEAAAIPPFYFEAPYYLAPDKRGAKGYALLRETLRQSGKAALAKVVIHSKQHLCAVLVHDDVLVLNTMRFADEVLAFSDLSLPGSDLADIGVGKRELEMAQRLVDDMTEEWSPEHYGDSYRDDLLARAEEKIAAGETHLLTPASAESEEGGRASAEIIDLAAMLKRSIEERGGRGRKGVDSARQAAKAGAVRKSSEKSPVTGLAKPRVNASKLVAPKTAAKTRTARRTAAKPAPAAEARRKRA